MGASVVDVVSVVLLAAGIGGVVFVALARIAGGRNQIKASGDEEAAVSPDREQER